ncbi:phage antirepressor KilAC domain-containing protein [Haemophilus paraphrohaemolyticus]|uniref:phage antirepressor KilAC domain-containing protein n=1 Tax=Haemophilus paraphrohaemolyticus TaxID=736 RepID=UPI0023F4F75F|nr:phage antirepressor KilAC domain-containing protein [Haemophilus paraphrohaemolyticus]
MKATELLPITEKNASLTMSSREIAELCEKEHRHVARDIEVMFEQLEIDTKGYAQIWTHPQNGQSYREFLLPKDLTLTLVAGYNVRLRKRIIDRWLELEAKQAVQLPQTFAEALRLAADLEEQKQALLLENQRMKPKVAFVEHYVEVGTTKSLRETAKILKMPEKAMIQRLVEDRILYRQSNNLLPYQKYYERELFAVKTGTAEHGHNFTQTRVTSKGMAFIANRYASELMQ